MGTTRAEIELAIWDIDRNFKVSTKSIVDVIYNLYDKDKQIIVYPDDYG